MRQLLQTVQHQFAASCPRAQLDIGYGHFFKGPALSYHGQMLILINQLQVNHSVIVMQINGPYPRRSDPGNRYFSYVKSNGIAFMTDCQQRLRGIFWLIIHYVNDLSVITLKLHVDRRRALITGSWLIFLELSLLDLTIAGSHQQRSWHVQPIKNHCLDDLFTHGQANRL